MMNRSTRKRITRLSVFGVVLLGGVVAAALGVVAKRSDISIDWRALGDVGQAFGTISAVLSAVALIGVGISLRYERQQARIAQNDTIRSLRTELLEFAIENPQYLKVWGFDSQAGPEEAQYAAYISLFFSYSKMSFDLDVLQDYELRQWCDVVFGDPDIVLFWENARNVYLGGKRSAKELRFATIVDRKYSAARQAALDRPDLVKVGPFLQTRKSGPLAPSRKSGPRSVSRPLSLLLAAVLVGALVGVVARARARPDPVPPGGQI